MVITVIGTGYVGLVSGVCFAEMGHTVWCVDVDAKKIATLKGRQSPIYEPGLQALIESNLRDNRLQFTTSLREALETAEICIIAVGTPQDEDGSADLKHVLSVAREIGLTFARPLLVVVKSTVPVGTAERVRTTINAGLQARAATIPFDVVSNPEFLKEGDAVHDFMRPDRIIIGAEDGATREAMRELYAPFTRNFDKVIFMSVRDAEMTKYAANSMLATKISYMNEIANLCEKLGVDVENVRKGMGADSRIGYSFIYPGCGYGGSCFPKDVRALINMANDAGMNAQVLRAVESRNNEQKKVLFGKICERFGADLSGKTLGVWGLSFKPGTDDVREAPSLVLLEDLAGAGAQVLAYDPVASAHARESLTSETSKQVHFVEHQYDAIAGSDALVLVTEWKPFRQPDFALMKTNMRNPIIFDGRNQYEPSFMAKEGFEYFGIGRGAEGAVTASSGKTKSESVGR
jgi:UDPglucose 6-dehydrogenase